MQENAHHDTARPGVADVREMRGDSDAVCALVQVCRKHFQLGPLFSFAETSAGRPRSKFHGALLPGSSGRNKREAKNSSAGVALLKVATNACGDLLHDEDESFAGNENVCTPGKKV